MGLKRYESFYATGFIAGIFLGLLLFGLWAARLLLLSLYRYIR